jgi:hypothetical protein
MGAMEKSKDPGSKERVACAPLMLVIVLGSAALLPRSQSVSHSCPWVPKVQVPGSADWTGHVQEALLSCYSKSQFSYLQENIMLRVI